MVLLFFFLSQYHCVLQTGFGVRGLRRSDILKLQVKHEMYLNSQRHMINNQDGDNRIPISRSFSGPIILQNVASNTLTADMVRNCKMEFEIWLYTFWLFTFFYPFNLIPSICFFSGLEFLQKKIGLYPHWKHFLITSKFIMVQEVRFVMES